MIEAQIVANSNPFNNSALVEGYENWYETAGRRADRLEKVLYKRLLADFPRARSLVEVGRGTGHFTRCFDTLELQMIGLDLSCPMLDMATRLGGPSYIQGDALMLPLLSKSIDLVTLITTLEFLSSPSQAMKEALRVARQGLILGVLNAHSILGMKYKLDGGPI
jgi:ubiquinone/menaquinone biosynthesis C-methylase UbiE